MRTFVLRIVSLAFVALFTLPFLAPLAAQATQGCCACGVFEAGVGFVPDRDHPKQIAACYSIDAGMTSGACTAARTAQWIINSLTTWNPGGVIGAGDLRACVWYPDKECDPNKEQWLQCPNTLSEESLLGTTQDIIHVKPVQRDSIAFTPQVSIPGTDFIAGKPIPGGIQPETIARYIAGIYYFLIASIGILAVVGIMVGGFQYLMAAGSPEKITEAKHAITSAITGLIIALTSYLLFTTINPDLVDFKAGVGRLTDVESEEAMINSELGVGACKESEQASDMLLLNTGVFTSGEPIVISGNVEKPPRLRADVVAKLRDSRLTSWLTSNNYKLVVTSAYRSQANQTALYSCYQKRFNGVGVFSNVCPFGCASCNQAAQPSCDAPHQTGFAVDVCLQGGTATVNDAACGTQNDSNHPTGVAKVLQQKMQQVGFGRYCREWWHFESPSLAQHSSWCEPGIYDPNQRTSGSGDSGDATENTVAREACGVKGGACSINNCTNGEIQDALCPMATSGLWQNLPQKCCKP